MWGDGTGHLARVNCTFSGNSDESMTVDEPGTQWLEEGMPIQTTDLTLPATLVTGDLGYSLTDTTCHIVGILTSDTVFEVHEHDDTVLEGASATEPDATDNDYVTRFGGGVPMQGLKGLVDNYAIRATSSWFGNAGAVTTPQGLSRATYPVLDATISHGSNTNRALTEDIIQAALDSIEKASGKKEQEDSQMMITTYGIRRKYIADLQADRRYQGNQVYNLKGGWKALAYQSGNKTIPMTVDRMAIPNSILILNKKFLQIYRAADWDWMDLDGSMFQRKIDSAGKYDAYEAMKFVYQNLGCSNFKAQGAIRDVTE